MRTRVACGTIPPGHADDAPRGRLESTRFAASRAQREATMRRVTPRTCTGTRWTVIVLDRDEGAQDGLTPLKRAACGTIRPGHADASVRGVSNLTR